MHDSVLFQAFVYLLAAVALVPLAQRFGLGSVLGYLIAGALIGPWGLRLAGGENVMHFAEFGVVMMLFLVGLELQPAMLWRMRTELLGLGGLQVVGTTAALAGLAVLLGLPGRVALAAGLTLAMSSTAIVLQTLNERGLLKTPGGRASFAVLLFQDISVIPILAVFPLLAIAAPSAGEGHAEGGWLSHQPGWLQGLFILAAVAVVIAAGRFLVRPALRAVARSGIRELFTAAALLLVVGIALLMNLVGLSPALGTFLAGVVLADSEYRHELETDIEPFKGLLLGLFFISVGAGLDFGLMLDRPGLMISLTLGLLVSKAAVLALLARLFRLRGIDGSLFALGLAQGGEFAFVLVSFGRQGGIFDAATAGPLAGAVALSMAMAPLLFVLHTRVIAPRLAAPRSPGVGGPPPEAEDHPVIVAGFGRFGHVVVRLLRAAGIGTTVLDLDADQIEVLRQLDLKCFYGDASRPDLLHAAGADRARLLVVAVESPETAGRIVETARKHFPHLRLLVRAHDRQHAYALRQAGVEEIFRETLDSSLELAVAALRHNGVRGYQARRLARLFRQHDEDSVRELAALQAEEPAYFRRARERIAEAERLIREDAPLRDDHAWDADSLRRGF